MNLAHENYFSLEANRHYMSVSQFKSFIPAYGGCEAKAMAMLAGEYEEPQKVAFIEGHLLHSWNQGTLAEFKANNPDLYSTRGATAGQLKANYKHCEKMIETLESDPFALSALAGQKEVIFTAELYGIPWKIMIDSYQPEIPDSEYGVFTDLKAMKSIHDKFWNSEDHVYENFVDHYGYNVQVGVYAEIERRATKRDKWLIPHMVIVTKEDPPDHDVIYFDYDDIQSGLAIVERHIERIKAVKFGQEKPIHCNKCDYCRAIKKVTRVRHYRELAIY